MPGWKTVNEIRQEENLPPVDGGDEMYKPITGTETETDVETTAKPDSGEPATGQEAA